MFDVLPYLHCLKQCLAYIRCSGIFWILNDSLNFVNFHSCAFLKCQFSSVICPLNISICTISMGNLIHFNYYLQVRTSKKCTYSFDSSPGIYPLLSTKYLHLADVPVISQSIALKQSSSSASSQLPFLCSLNKCHSVAKIAIKTFIMNSSTFYILHVKSRESL